MDYPSKVLVTDFAQLSLDVYEDKGENNLKSSFNNSWRKINTWTSPNQFHATFYKNMQTNVGALSIRGTDMAIIKTIWEDFLWVDGEFGPKNMPQFTEAIQFYIFLQNFSLWKETSEKYVCGHSLGGMLAKALAPVTGLNTIAFNSPGMRRYLMNNHFKANLEPNQKQINYVSANDDLVGRSLDYYDNGKYIYIIPDKKEDTIINELTPLHFHKMKLLYTTLKNGSHKNDYF